jgi:hypothetical protein
MPAGQVAVQEGVQRRLGSVRRHGVPTLAGPGKYACTSLNLQIFLGFEVAVKAAMGEAGGLHQVRDADAVEAPLAKQSAGGVDDAVPVLGGLFPAHSHRSLPGPKKSA